MMNNILCYSLRMHKGEIIWGFDDTMFLCLIHVVLFTSQVCQNPKYPKYGLTGHFNMNTSLCMRYLI